MEDRLIQQLDDMRVVETVKDLAPMALGDHQPEVAKDPQLLRNRRLLHPHAIREFIHGARTSAELTEDQ